MYISNVCLRTVCEMAVFVLVLLTMYYIFALM